MSSERAIKAGEAFVEFSMRDAKLKTGLAGIKSILQGLGAGMKTLGQGLATAGASILLPLGYATKQAADFQTQMNLVSTLLDDPALWMARYRVGVRDLSIQFGKSSADMASGLYDILSASIPASDALYVLSEAGKAAVAGNTETAIATDALTTILNAYNLSASQAGHVSDVLFQTVLRGKTTFAKVAGSIGNVATTAATAGVPLEDLGAMLALLTRNGIGTDEAVTSLQAILSSFLSPSDAAAAAARKLGFEMNSATLKSMGLQRIFAKLAGLPPDIIAELFPNIRALKGLLPALQSMDGFATDLAATRHAAGATDRAFAKMAASVNFAFDQMVSAGKALMVAIGDPLLDATGEALHTLTGLAGGIADAVKANPQLVTTALKVGAALAAAGVVIFGVGAALVTLAATIGAIAGIIAAFSAAWPVLAAGVSGVAAAFALLLSPAVAVGIAVASITLSIQQGAGAFDSLYASIKGVAAVMRSDFMEAFAGIRDAFMGGDLAAASRVMWAYLDLEWARGVTALKIAWIELWETVAIGASVGALSVYETWQGLIMKLRGLWSSFVGWFQSKVESLSGVLAKVLMFHLSLGHTDGFDAVDEITRQGQEDVKRASAKREAEIAADYAARIAEGRAHHQAEIDGLANASNAAIKTQEDRVAAAQTALAEANKQAAAARAALTQKPASSNPRPDVAGAVAGTRQAAALASGDFSADYLRRLSGGASDAADRTAQASEKAVSQREKTNRLLIEILAKPGVSFT